jgi:DNA-binding phage protein
MAQSKRKVLSPPKPRLSERDKLFIDLLAIIGTTNLYWLADQAGVSHGTLYNWLDGKTMKPRIDTLTKVAKACGYEIVLKRVKGPHLKLVRTGQQW